MGYHIDEIPRGEFGEVSKIREELLELEDAIKQNNTIMALIELSDMIGAIEGFVLKNTSLTLSDLIIMKDATKKAFEDGTRNSRIPSEDGKKSKGYSDVIFLRE